MRAAEAAAQRLKIRLQSVEVRNPADFERAFAAMGREGADALVVLVDVMLVDHRREIADMAAARRLPAVYGQTEHVRAGGLMAYAASFANNYRRAAEYVDKILKGARAGDLPIEQPTQFEMS